MNRTHTLLIALFITLFTTGAATAQITAPFAAGLRGTPDGGGLNLRFFFNENLALEGQLNTSGGNDNGNGPSKTAVLLVEGHVLLPADPRFRLFIGGGAHYGNWQRYSGPQGSPKEAVFGFDLILGPEYVFASVPIGISIDVKPALSYIGGTTLFPANTFGLSLRYYFGAWQTYDSHVEDK